jgi:putative redox protein
MKVEINRLNDHLLMEALNENGHKVLLDGEDAAFRPMQLVLAAVGSCSTIDVVLILKKQREPLEDIQVVVEGARHEDKIPKTFKTINIHYILKGSVNPEKAKRAIELSMNKYCSVSEMLRATVEITYSFEIQA